MASTYSDLKIQLMTTGENTGAWGTVTNTNLGTAIEEAITGSTTVTFASADVTLTLTNTNATQPARHLRLNCAGTTGGSTRNLILGSGCQIDKVYIVNNGCADSIVVKNTTGNGITVPAGKTMYVFNNGTDVVDVVTHLTSLTLGSALPVASGGTGSNTGDGSALTNLNASNITTGTLANARTTAASANGASTIVARDASGNFSANTITANLTGTAANATILQTARTIAIQDGVTGTATSFNGSTNISIPVTGINASVIDTGTIANARTTASSSNGASTIVARDASGDFTGRNVSATNFIGALNGSGANVTSLNASNISSGTLAVARGGTGASTLTANNVILGNGTSAVSFVAPGTSGNVLTSNGTTWTSSAAFPSGGIIMWSGSIATIPSGWALCDGTSGTPDLRNRFVVGAGSTYAVAATGGSADATVVSHTHTYSTTTGSNGDHTHTVYSSNDTQTVPRGFGESASSAVAAISGSSSLGYKSTLAANSTAPLNTTGAHTHSVSGTTDSSGSSGTNANLPPYYALAYIMKL